MDSWWVGDLIGQGWRDRWRQSTWEGRGHDAIDRACGDITSGTALRSGTIDITKSLDRLSRVEFGRSLCSLMVLLGCSPRHYRYSL